MAAEKLKVKEVADAERQNLQLEKAHVIVLLEKHAAMGAVDKNRNYNLKVQTSDTEMERMTIKFKKQRIQKEKEFDNILEGLE